MNERFRQIADVAWQVRQPIPGRLRFEPLAIFDGRISGIESRGGNVVWDAALCGNDSAVADGEMASGANLSGQDAGVADSRGTREPDLSAEHGIGPDLRGVTNQNEI